jgi:hypothetical protein
MVLGDLLCGIFEKNVIRHIFDNKFLTASHVRIKSKDTQTKMDSGALMCQNLCMDFIFSITESV